MRKIRSLLRDDSGANLVEFAIALPVLVSFIWGIFQFGLVFQAQAGMQHALGEAARMATLYPTPLDQTIKDKVTAKKFGTYNGTLGTLQIQDISSGGTVVAKKLTLTYSQPTNFLFVAGPTITITKDKTVYLSN